MYTLCSHNVLYSFPLYIQVQALTLPQRQAPHASVYFDDIRDSPLWKERVINTGFAADNAGRNLVFAMSGDGCPVYNMRYGYSVKSFQCQLLNLTPMGKADAKNLFHAMILPGPKQPKAANIFVNRMAKMFKELETEGVEVKDASRKNVVMKVKAMLLLTVNDYPGKAWFHHYQEQGSLNPCSKCMVQVIR